MSAVNSMIDRIECGLAPIEGTHSNSDGNVVEVMGPSLILAHSPCMREPYNNAEALIDHVIDRLYAIELDKAVEQLEARWAALDEEFSRDL